MTAQFRTAAALVVTLVAAQSMAADNPQRAFVADWQGRTVVIRQRLYSLVYNERGSLGKTYSGRREGLTVITPHDGVFFEFAGRHRREDVSQRDVATVIQQVSREYEADSLDVRGYRKLEPVALAQYDPGGELRIARAEVLRDGVRLVFAQSDGPDAADDPVSSLTVRWPLPLSKSFSERPVIEQLIANYIERR